MLHPKSGCKIRLEFFIDIRLNRSVYLIIRTMGARSSNTHILDPVRKVWRANQTWPKATSGLGVPRALCRWKLQLEAEVHLMHELRELTKLDLVISRSSKPEPERVCIDLVGMSGLRRQVLFRHH